MTTSQTSTSRVATVLARLDAVRGWQEELYATCTSTRSSRSKSGAPRSGWPSGCGPPVQGPRGRRRHRRLAVLRNGGGDTVLLRADMDGLPVREATGLPCASTVTAGDPNASEVPVMHACGHDLHVSCLLGAAQLLADGPDAWRGTLVAQGGTTFHFIDASPADRRLAPPARRALGLRCAASDDTPSDSRPDADRAAQTTRPGERAAMPDLEIKRTVRLSREEAGQRLIALGTALTGGSKSHVDFDGNSIRFTVPDQLEWEFELEVEGDETELEIELKWSDPPTAAAAAAEPAAMPRSTKATRTARR